MIRGEENNVSCETVHSLPKRKNHSSLVGFPLEKTHITCFQIEVIVAGLVKFHDHHHLRNGNICSRTSRIVTGPQERAVIGGNLVGCFYIQDFILYMQLSKGYHKP